MKYLKTGLSIFALLLLLSSCQKKNFSNKLTYQFTAENQLPDYSDLHYWAASPEKWDPSDSVPKPLRKNYIKDSTVDVFFIYPTTFTNAADTAWNAAIDDKELNAKTDYSTILYQASAFAKQTRVFAPRYRQAHYRAFTSSDKKSAAAALNLAYSDVKKAFEYYLKYKNNGRPIIIAAHSQGTLHAKRLLQEFFDGPTLKNKLVAAYLIGMPLQEKDFKNIAACRDTSQTGCFVSWRTFHKNYEGPAYIQNESFKTVNTNPLTWRTDTIYAPENLNKGGILYKFNKVIPAVVDAQVHGNMLWASKPDFFGKIFLTQENYHIADINLFYVNIAEDVKRRIGLFWKN